MTIELTITREDAEASRDLTVLVEYTRSAYGIDFAVLDEGIELTPAETDALYEAIWECEGEDA